MKCISWNVNGLRAVMKKGFTFVGKQAVDSISFAITVLPPLAQLDFRIKQSIEYVYHQIDHDEVQ